MLPCHSTIMLALTDQFICISSAKIDWLNDCFTAQHSKLISAKEAVSYFTRLTLGRHSRQAGKPRAYIFYPGTNTGRNELRINERRATELAVGTRYVNVTTKQTNYDTRTYYRSNGLLIFSTGILSLSLGNWSGHVLHSYRLRKKTELKGTAWFGHSLDGLRKYLDFDSTLRDGTVRHVRSPWYQ
jgi:hypothetical protein